MRYSTSFDVLVSKVHVSVSTGLDHVSYHVTKLLSLALEVDAGAWIRPPEWFKLHDVNGVALHLFRRLVSNRRVIKVCGAHSLVEGQPFSTNQRCVTNWCICRVVSAVANRGFWSHDQVSW